MGYLTGISIEDNTKSSTMFNLVDPEKVIKKIEDYCEAHPTLHYFEAVNHVYRDLDGKTASDILQKLKLYR